jgi:toxin ParE1/3/4
MRYVLSAKAEHDLKDIRQFGIARWGKAHTRAYLRSLRAAFQLLAEMPDIETAYEEVRPGLRRHVSGSHLIFYRLDIERMIEIVRVLHQSRDVALLL